MFVYRYPFTVDQVIPDPEWEVFLRETASMIVAEQTPRRYIQHLVVVVVVVIVFVVLRLLEVRGRYYELLTHCIPPDIIFRVMTFEHYLLVCI